MNKYQIPFISKVKLKIRLNKVLASNPKPNLSIFDKNKFVK